MRQQGRLGEGRIVEVGFGSFPANAGKRNAEALVGLGENITGDGVGLRQLLAHPDLLRTLAGEDEGRALGVVGHCRRPVRGRAYALLTS